MCVEGVWGLGVALKLQGSFACLALPSANSRQDGHAWHNTILELQCSFNPTKQGLSGHYRCQNTPCIVNERSTATGGVELARCPAGRGLGLQGPMWHRILGLWRWDLPRSVAPAALTFGNAGRGTSVDAYPHCTAQKYRPECGPAVRCHVPLDTHYNTQIIPSALQ
jgi:hypothetical protein